MTYAHCTKKWCLPVWTMPGWHEGCPGDLSPKWSHFSLVPSSQTPSIHSPHSNTLTLTQHTLESLEFGHQHVNLGDTMLPYMCVFFVEGSDSMVHPMSCPCDGIMKHGSASIASLQHLGERGSPMMQDVLLCVENMCCFCWLMNKPALVYGRAEYS